MAVRCHQLCEGLEFIFIIDTGQQHLLFRDNSCKNSLPKVGEGGPLRSPQIMRIIVWVSRCAVDDDASGVKTNLLREN